MSDTTAWRRACNYGDCAEVMETCDGVWVRSSRNTDAVTAFTVEEWQRFRADVKAGRFDDVAPAEDQVAALERLRGIEQRAREYVEAVDRGRQRGVANLGRPILQFQPLRAALGIGPFLGDDDA